MLEDLFKQVKTRMGEAVPSVLKGGTRPMSIPSDLLFKCPKCQHVEDADDFIANNKVCSACGYHARLTASERLRLTADPGSFQEYDPDMTSLNPLKFAGYDKKQQELRERTRPQGRGGHRRVLHRGLPLRRHCHGQPLSHGLHGFGGGGEDHPRL